MRKKLTQCDIAVLYIAERKGEWVYAYELKKAPFVNGHHLGSEGDRRAQELFEKEETFAKRTVNDFPYTIERGYEGRYCRYRLVGETPPKYEYREIERDGQIVRLKVLV